MFSTLFKTQPVIDESSRDWIFDTFAWCIQHLDGDFFKNNSELILPNNNFYPGKVSSVEEMADAIFTNTLKYTGLSNWPIKLVPAERYIQKQIPALSFDKNLRGEHCKVSSQASYTINDEEIAHTIDIAFHPSQLNQPQDLIAYLVQKQASILISQQKIAPPGGKETLAQTIDLVACFMGFGVIFANTAYQFKGGCGSCNNRNLNRQAALPELETVYALALFTVLKNGDIKQVKKALKSHLYKPFRQAHKEISTYLQQGADTKHGALLLS
ncbi:hypothetical protein [Thalassotalea sp. PLHSN55]|uniref:hypothetical protein n=1 Tax=Thalassotalea sp. PLHSN55 TaxID=3435888 RepID=UPI003F87890C